MTLRYHQAKINISFQIQTLFYEDISYLDYKMNFKMHLKENIT